MDMSTGLEISLLRPIRRAWERILGLFSKKRRFAADVIDAMERGDGTTTFAWWWDEEELEEREEEYTVDDLMADIDETIRRAPSPLGCDEFVLKIIVCKEMRRSEEGVPEGRKAIRFESFVLDRYYDWHKGDARSRVRAILEESAPCPQAPLVGVVVLPIGGAIASLLRQRIWQPVSPWMR
jgi:hypothetical protein